MCKFCDSSEIYKREDLFTDSSCLLSGAVAIPPMGSATTPATSAGFDSKNERDSSSESSSESSSDNGDDTEDELITELSVYEKDRLDNITRNERKLIELGIVCAESKGDATVQNSEDSGSEYVPSEGEDGKDGQDGEDGEDGEGETTVTCRACAPVTGLSAVDNGDGTSELKHIYLPDFDIEDNTAEGSAMSQLGEKLFKDKSQTNTRNLYGLYHTTKRGSKAHDRTMYCTAYHNRIPATKGAPADFLVNEKI